MRTWSGQTVMNLLLGLSIENTSVIKRLFCLLTKPFLCCTAIMHKERQWTISRCDKPPPRWKYWYWSAVQRLIWTGKLKAPFLTEAISAVLFSNCFEVQLRLAEPSGCIQPNVLTNGITSSNEVFRCELALNCNAWVRTFRLLKYECYVCLDPT